MDAHNKYRAVHGAKPLKIDKDLMESAKTYATELSKSGILKESKLSRWKKKTGENLYLGCTTHPNKKAYKGKAEYVVFRW